MVSWTKILFYLVWGDNQRWIIRCQLASALMLHNLIKDTLMTQIYLNVFLHLVVRCKQPMWSQSGIYGWANMLLTLHLPFQVWGYSLHIISVLRSIIPFFLPLGEGSDTFSRSFEEMMIDTWPSPAYVLFMCIYEEKKKSTSKTQIYWYWLDFEHFNSDADSFVYSAKTLFFP